MSESELQPGDVWVESWRSDSNEEEIHYFLKDTDRYVLGFNPAAIAEDAIVEILASRGFIVAGKRKRAPANWPRARPIVPSPKD